MKKVALLLAVLGSCFFAGCAQEESATVDTTEETAPATEDAGTATEDAATTPAL